ncbi:MAG: 3-deoxy-D-manno-octulosonic acid transferase [Desulfopila sp.]
MLYRIIVALLFYCSLPLLLLGIVISGRHRRGVWQRFACYPPVRSQRAEEKTIWVHASSVGEVQAARTIINAVTSYQPTARIILTVMTEHGWRVAQSRLGDEVQCLLAPLDIPGIVGRAVAAIRPDIYICLETELWPVLVDTLAHNNVRLCMANGRISQKSYGTYRLVRFMIRRTVRQFDRIAVISARDRDRFVVLGAAAECVAVEGNVKYDVAVPAEHVRQAEHYRELLDIGDMEVFVAGSTHGNEELELAWLYRELHKKNDTLFIVAPRHLERMPAIVATMEEQNIACQLFAMLASGRAQRQASMILVDTMGELAVLYGLADYIFCGGSLAARGGHNIMEAAAWQKAVFYGPHMDDFHDAVELLESVEGGFKVENVADLKSRIEYFRNHPREYEKACIRAGEAARAQQGSAARQVSFLLSGDH